MEKLLLLISLAAGFAIKLVAAEANPTPPHANPSLIQATTTLRRDSKGATYDTKAE